MKKLLVGLLIAFGSITTLTAQEESTGVKNAVKFELTGVFLGQFQFGYERALNENFTVEMKGGFVSRSLSWSVNDDQFTSQASGFVVCPEVKYYVDESLKGFYLGGYGRFRQVNVNFEEILDNRVIDESERQRTRVSGGILLGYQEVINNRVTLDIFAAPQYVHAENKYISGDENLDSVNSSLFDYKGAGLRLGFTLGVAF